MYLFPGFLLHIVSLVHLLRHLEGRVSPGDLPVVGFDAVAIASGVLVQPLDHQDLDAAALVLRYDTGMDGGHADRRVRGVGVGAPHDPARAVGRAADGECGASVLVLGRHVPHFRCAVHRYGLFSAGPVLSE